jgi:hypothetical protein
VAKVSFGIVADDEAEDSVFNEIPESTIRTQSNSPILKMKCAAMAA